MCRYSQIAARAGLTAGPGAKGGDAAVTSEDRMLMEEERGEELDLKAKMEASLIMCSKAGNIQGCEDALDQDAFIDCTSARWPLGIAQSVRGAQCRAQCRAQYRAQYRVQYRVQCRAQYRA